MSEMVERVQDAVTPLVIAGPAGDTYGHTLAIARAAIEAMREPTPEMVEAGMGDWLVRSTTESRVRRPYAAMINAALGKEQ